MLRVLLGLTSIGLLSGCLDEPQYACQRSEQCLLEGYVGTCDAASGRCVYPAAECRGMQSIAGYTDGRGNCVPAPNGQAQTSTGAASSGTGGSTAETTDASTTVGLGTTGPLTSGETTTEPESTSEATTSEATTSEATSAGSTGTSGGSSSTSGGASCDNPVGDITGYGSVSASSALNGFGPSRAVDDDNSTSWMGGAGTSRMYRWNSEQAAERCIQRVEIDDNSMHASAKFHAGYGFEQAIVRVLQGDLVVFEETVPLPGTPDGNWSVEVGAVVGTRVTVEVGPFENEFAGGFSEFRVIGNPLL